MCTYLGALDRTGRISLRHGVSSPRALWTGTTGSTIKQQILVPALGGAGHEAAGLPSGSRRGSARSTFSPLPARSSRPPRWLERLYRGFPKPEAARPDEVARRTWEVDGGRGSRLPRWGQCGVIASVGGRRADPQITLTASYEQTGKGWRTRVGR